MEETKRKIDKREFSRVTEAIAELLQGETSVKVSDLERVVPRDFDLSGRRGRSPILSIAIYKQQHEAAEWLLERGVDPNFANYRRRLRTPLMEAIEYAPQLVELLLKKGASVCCEFGGAYPLHRAACKNNTDVCRLLINAGARVDVKTANGYTALQLATANETRSFLENVVVTELFVGITVRGILSTGEFRDFLAEGVCDARLLIHIANFAYR